MGYVYSAVFKAGDKGRYRHTPAQFPYKDTKLTIKEIADIAGCATSTVHKHVQAGSKTAEEFIKWWQNRIKKVKKKKKNDKRFRETRSNC